ncbi:MAG: Helix-turn-helix domain [Firmicutes bacterium]|nr:Helix-turn-helix domain [Bacillota bacterium]
MNNVYTLKETAGMLKTSVKTTQKLIDNGKLIAFKIGQQWRVAESSIDEYVNNMLMISKKKIKDKIDKSETVVENNLHASDSAMPINILEKVIEQPENEQNAENIPNNKVTDSIDIGELIKLGFTYQQIADKLNSSGSLTITNKAWTKKSVAHQIEKTKKEILKHEIIE